MDYSSERGECVVDSEGEGDPVQLKAPPPNPKPVIEPADTSIISEFTNDNVPRASETISTASSKVDSPKPKSKPRPKPKPAFNPKPVEASPPSDHIETSSMAPPTVLSIADRAKMRARGATKPPPMAEVIEIPSSDDGFALEHPPPRNKDLSKPSAPKERPKPRPIKKPDASSSKVPTPPLPSSPRPTHTGSVAISEAPSFVPTEPNAISSSPLSSPIARPPTIRKRPIVQEDDDNELSTFFASSSSVTPLPVEPPQEPKKARKRNIEEEGFGEDEAPKQKRPRAKAKGKKKDGEVKKSKGKGKDKEPEVFKSREFIEDDDELDGLFSEPDSSLSKPSNSSANASRLGDLAGQPTANSDGNRPSPSATESIPVPAPPTAKKTKKRKSAAEDDAEDFAEQPQKKKRAPSKQIAKDKAAKSKKKDPILSNDEENQQPETERQPSPPPPAPVDPPSPKQPMPPPKIVSPAEPSPPSDTPAKPKQPTLASRYSIASRTKSTPMSELIRRANSLPSSPFPTPHSARATAYSPYLKSSRTALSRIAPLHPNRKPPPPPLPPPPPRQKTKKEKEMEERWEEELIEDVGGMQEWVAMPDHERKEMRRVKREREMGGWED